MVVITLKIHYNKRDIWKKFEKIISVVPILAENQIKNLFNYPFGISI
jgi:hypothetical protein